MRTTAAVLWEVGMPWSVEEIELDGLITRTYTLEDVNQGYADVHAGKNIRGVIVM